MAVDFGDVGGVCGVEADVHGGGDDAVGVVQEVHGGVLGGECGDVFDGAVGGAAVDDVDGLDGGVLEERFDGSLDVGAFVEAGHDDGCLTGVAGLLGWLVRGWRGPHGSLLLS